MRKTYTVAAQAWSAGAVGTRAAQVTLKNTAIADMDIVGVTIANPASTSSYIPIVFLSSETVLVNFYRTSANAYKNETYSQEMNVVVTYAKYDL